MSFLTHLSRSAWGSGTKGAPLNEPEPPPAEPPDTLLAHATSQKSMPAGRLERLMSNKMASTPAASRATAAKGSKGTTKVKKHEVYMDDDGNIYSIRNVNIVRETRFATIR